MAAFIENYHQQLKRAYEESLDYSSIRKTIDDPETRRYLPTTPMAQSDNAMTSAAAKA